MLNIYSHPSQVKEKQPVSDGHFAGRPCLFATSKDVTVLERKDFIFSTFVVKKPQFKPVLQSPKCNTINFPENFNRKQYV